MPNNKQTTAVQWLMEQMLSNEFHNPYFEEALKIERKQIENAYIEARKHSISSSGTAFTTPSDYFTSTFITD